MREIESVGPEVPFRQGDVIRFGSGGDEDYAVILTADCDIANNKFGDCFSILPIISAVDFLTRVWIKRRAMAARDRAIRLVLNEIRRSLQEITGERPSIDEVTLFELIRRRSDEEILKIFQLSENKQVVQSLPILRIDIDAHSCETFPTTVNTIIQKGHISEIENAFRQIGLEYFYFNYLPDNTRIGNIVLLRQLGVIDRLHVAPSLTTSRTAGQDAYRIGRFRPEFKHSIAQAFATLFARIGLPEEFEEEREHAWSLVAQEVLGWRP